MKTITTGWVDLLVAIILLWGMMRGRKRGMSEELLDVLKWGVIVVVAGLFYEPCGRVLAHYAVFSPLSAYLFSYLAIACCLFVMFALLRKHVGEKLVGSDTFGSGEYYLGMLAGTFRYLCIVLVSLALLNARYYSPAEVKDSVRYQQENFGSDFFTTLPDIQREVFDESAFGQVTRRYLRVVLIRPTPPGPASSKPTVARAREATINEILDRK